PSHHATGATAERRRPGGAESLLSSRTATGGPVAEIALDGTVEAHGALSDGALDGEARGGIVLRPREPGEEGEGGARRVQPLEVLGEQHAARNGRIVD